MNRQQTTQAARCNECSLTFDNLLELQNHKRRFCLNSGYDNLDGLAQLEWQGNSPPHRPQFSHKNHLQQYGSNSLTHLADHNTLTEDNLNQDMHNINRFKRQIEKVHKYKHMDPVQSQVSGNSKVSLAQTRLTNKSYSESRLEEELKQYEKPVKEEAVGADAFIDQLNMRNHTVLDKSNSSIGRMPPKDKMEYARVKLDELNSIKALYIQNGGNKAEFKGNVLKMIEFYEKLLKEQQAKQKKDEERNLNDSQEFEESRCFTPILKLRSLDESNVSKASKRSNQAKKPPAQSIPSQQQPPMNPYFPQMNGYPPMMMMPYLPPPQQTQSNDSMRLLQKMMELKSEENKQLMEILLQDRRKPSQPTVNRTGPMEQSFPKSPTRRVGPQGRIDVTEDYQFKKPMDDELISEEKVLLALQQEELDELKLLSQLPKEIQEMKMASVIKSSDTRFQVEKELLKQKHLRLAYQEENQTFEEGRKFNNDRWAGEERKKLLEKQVGSYLDNFETHFNN